MKGETQEPAPAEVIELKPLEVCSPLPWRVGNKVGRTIYDADGNLIGCMDIREDAAALVEAVNAHDKAVGLASVTIAKYGKPR